MTSKAGTISKPNIELDDSRVELLYRVSGSAALIAAALFLIAIIDPVVTGLRLGTTSGWLSLVQNNWLVVIFKLHAGFGGVRSSLLHGLNLLDISILVLVGTVYLGLYGALRRTSRIWSTIALIQPFLGIVIFAATKTAGRSTVMSAALVISLVMLRNEIFSKVTAYTGIAASVLLLVGDFSVGIPQSNIVATLFAVGYVLMLTWFFLIGGRLLQLGTRGGRRLGTMSVR